MAARIAVGRRDMERAVGSAADTADRARRLGDAALVAEAAASMAFAHLAVGDLDAVDRDVAGCLTAARAARDPLRGIRARLLLAESARRRGRRSAVDALLQRLNTLGGASVPPIVQARCAMLKDLAASAAADDDIVRRHVRATGLDALALLVPTRAAAFGVGAPAVDDLIEILHACQNADEEHTVLADVCARVRRQLRAAATAFVGLDAGRPITIASTTPDSVLWAAYSIATCTVFPSLNEGFGLPVAESLAIGTPVVTSNFGSMKEIAADGGAILVDPRSDEDIARGISAILSDPKLRAHLVQQAGARPQRTWAEYAEAVWGHISPVE